MSERDVMTASEMALAYAEMQLANTTLNIVRMESVLTLRIQVWRPPGNFGMVFLLKIGSLCSS